MHLIYTISTPCLHHVYNMSTSCLYHVYTMSTPCLHYSIGIYKHRAHAMQIIGVTKCTVFYRLHIYMYTYAMLCLDRYTKRQALATCIVYILPICFCILFTHCLQFIYSACRLDKPYQYMVSCLLIKFNPSVLTRR